MCIFWRSVALHFAKLCLPKPLPLLLGTGRTPRPQTRLRVPTQSVHPSKYPHRRPTTLICCPPKGFQKPWKGKVGKEKEIELPEEAYEKGAETPDGILVGTPGWYVVANISIWLCVSRHFHAKCVLSLSCLHPTYPLCCRRG